MSDPRRRIVPVRVKKFVYRHSLSPKRMRPTLLVAGAIQVRRAVRRGLDPAPAIHLMARGWGNQGFAAGADFVTLAVRDALALRAPVIELGSGLSTIALALATAHTAQPLVTLEHDRRWARTVRRRARWCRASVDVRDAPLVDIGPADWYDVQLDQLPTAGLVVCDGPPERTRGGRHGLLVAVEHLGPPAVVLLDDTERFSEATLVDVLRDRYDYTVERRAGLGGRGHARLTRP